MKKRRMHHVFQAIVFTAVFGMLVWAFPARAVVVPFATETITAEDNSTWQRVSNAGFGNANNIAVTALCAYDGRLYVLTRNDVEGFELWRATSGNWSQVTVTGFTDSVRHAFLNGGYGAMTVFDGCLYVAVGSGIEGDQLYRSVGLEMWRFDGSNWEAVISDARSDLDKATGQITGISDCAAEDTAETAQMTDSTKAWTTDQWAGGVLKIVSGDGTGRVFDIVENDATTLTIQQNEAAIEDAENPEYTVCSAFAPDEDHPELSVGAVAAGDSYLITQGWQANGFGEIWNKNLIGFAEYQGELYLSVAHNYAQGTRIWKTADGLAWEASSDYSFGLKHGFDQEGNPTDFCEVESYRNRNGGPVCSSSTYLHKTGVTGSETLIVGGTGSSGCNGRGARVISYDGTDWEFIVDYFVDENSDGTNENGFGDADSFLTANFQAWSWADYDNYLFVGVARPAGGRIMYTATGGTADDAWKYAVGGDGPMPEAFDNSGGLLGFGINLGAHLYTYDAALWAATFVNTAVPGFPFRLDGADIWRATGDAEALVWTRVTDTGFGHREIVNFGHPVEFENTLYIGGSNIFGNFTDDGAEDGNGCLVFKLVNRADWIDLDALQADAEMFSIDLSWTVNSAATIEGYNLYASWDSSMSWKIKLNRELIEDTSFTHAVVWPGSNWWYLVEAVASDGATATFGPLPVTAKTIFGM